MFTQTQINWFWLLGMPKYLAVIEFVIEVNVSVWMLMTFMRLSNWKTCEIHSSLLRSIILNKSRKSVSIIVEIILWLSKVNWIYRHTESQSYTRISFDLNTEYSISSNVVCVSLWRLFAHEIENAAHLAQNSNRNNMHSPLSWQKLFISKSYSISNKDTVPDNKSSHSDN